MKPRIKVCCMGSVEEARTAVAHGASAVGLVGRMPSGPGPITDELIHDVAAAVPPPCASFLLTSETTAYDFIAQHRPVLSNTIKILDSLTDRE